MVTSVEPTRIFERETPSSMMKQLFSSGWPAGDPGAPISSVARALTVLGESADHVANARRSPLPTDVRGHGPPSAAGATRGCVSERANEAMDRYARGDDAAFADVYDAVAPRIHAYLLRQTRDRGRADDLLQQTLLQMHRHRGTYGQGTAVIPWAFAIARRLYIDDFRRRKTDALCSARGVADDDRVASSLPDEEMASREIARLVEAELLRMPEAQRVAFELLRIEGLSHDEAAEVLGTTVNAVKLRVFRAYSAIRAALGRSAHDSKISQQRGKP